MKGQPGLAGFLLQQWHCHHQPLRLVPNTHDVASRRNHPVFHFSVIDLYRACNMGHRTGIGTCGPAVGHGKHGGSAVIMQHNINRLGTVTVAGLHLFEHIILISPVGKIEITPVRRKEYCGTILIRLERHQRLTVIRTDKEGLSPVAAVRIKAADCSLPLVCLCRRVELKLYTRQGLSVLIYFRNPLVKQGLKVKTQRNAGIIISPLQIKHFQGMGGIACKGISRPGCVPFFVCILIFG